MPLVVESSVVSRDSSGNQKSIILDRICWKIRTKSTRTNLFDCSDTELSSVTSVWFKMGIEIPSKIFAIASEILQIFGDLEVVSSSVASFVVPTEQVSTSFAIACKIKRKVL